MNINIQVKNDLLKEFGAIHIQEFLQRQLELYELQVAANKITPYLQETDTDWENEFDQARQEAWNLYKQQFFNQEKNE